MELAENLRELGMEITIVQRPKQLMNPFDSDIAAFIHNEMRKHGVKLALGHTVEGVAEVSGGVDVLLKDEQPLHVGYGNPGHWCFSRNHPCKRCRVRTGH